MAAGAWLAADAAPRVPTNQQREHTSSTAAAAILGVGCKRLTAMAASTSSESKQDGGAIERAASAAVAARAEEQEILDAADRLSHYHEARHHFHKTGSHIAARFGRVFVAGAGCVVWLVVRAVAHACLGGAGVVITDGERDAMP